MQPHFSSSQQQAQSGRWHKTQQPLTLKSCFDLRAGGGGGEGRGKKYLLPGCITPFYRISYSCLSFLFCPASSMILRAVYMDVLASCTCLCPQSSSVRSCRLVEARGAGWGGPTILWAWLISTGRFCTSVSVHLLVQYLNLCTVCGYICSRM